MSPLVFLVPDIFLLPFSPSVSGAAPGSRSWNHSQTFPMRLRSESRFCQMRLCIGVWFGRHHQRYKCPRRRLVEQDLKDRQEHQREGTRRTLRWRHRLGSDRRSCFGTKPTFSTDHFLLSPRPNNSLWTFRVSSRFYACQVAPFGTRIKGPTSCFFASVSTIVAPNSGAGTDHPPDREWGPKRNS